MGGHQTAEAAPEQVAEHQKSYDALILMFKIGIPVCVLVAAIAITTIVKWAG